MEKREKLKLAAKLCGGTLCGVLAVSGALVAGTQSASAEQEELPGIEVRQDRVLSKADEAEIERLAEEARKAEEERLAREQAEEQARLEEEARIAAEEEYIAELEEEGYVIEDGAVYYGGLYVAEYSDLYNKNGPSRTMPGWYDDHLETYYSSNVLYHYRTDEWTVDDEGFYRDSDGRYVIGVAAEEVKDEETGEHYQIGDVVQTGKGEAVVMDFGSGALVHDFYTNW